MAGPTPVSLSGVAFVPLGTPGAGTLRTGQVLQGSVVGSPGNLELRVAGLRALLGASIALTPGQTVNVTVEAAEGGLRLSVAPLASAAEVLPGSPAAEALPGPASMLPGFLSRALDLLGAADRRDALVPLVPASLPPSVAAARALLALFISPSSLAGDLELLATMTGRALEAGALPQELGTRLGALLGGLLSTEAEALPATLRQWAAQARHTLEARVLEALTSGRVAELPARLQEDLRALLLRLHEDEGMRGHLVRRGELGAFEGALERVLERLAGSQLQNLRAFEGPYLFLELPAGEGAAFARAQVHVFGEGGHGGRGFDARHASVALDLSTASLGDLWVDLVMVEGRCRCTLRAARPETVAAIARELGDLERTLADAGYPGAVLQVVPWDGNRLAETARLMHRFSSVDVRA